MILISKFTSEMTSNDWNDYLSVFKVVFNQSSAADIFVSIRFVRNIYGDSLHVLAYDNDKCVGIQSFFREDLNENLCFQSVDSAVLLEYRGHGLLKKMILFGETKLPPESLVYGFPNKNSLPSFKKIGWIQIYKMKYTFLFFEKSKNENAEIDNKYLKWILRTDGSSFLIKKGNNYYLAKNKGRIFTILYSKIRHFDFNFKKYVRRCSRIKLTYSKAGFFGKGLFLVAKPTKGKLLDIPPYKMDTLFE